MRVHDGASVLQAKLVRYIHVSTFELFCDCKRTGTDRTGGSGACGGGSRVGNRKADGVTREMKSITSQRCGCLNCNWAGTVGDCEPDVDGDGSLGCPQCGEVVTIYADRHPMKLTGSPDSLFIDAMNRMDEE